MYKVLIVEDNKELADGLELLLSRQGYGCFPARSTEEAEELFKQQTFDICILDITLPDGNGIDLCKKLRGEKENLVILFVTADDREDTIVQGFMAGGDDYLVKPFRSRELLARMAAILRRSTQKENVRDRWFISGDVAVNFEEMKLFREGREILLRPMEFSLLKLLLEGNGGLLKREMIFEKLWDKDEKYVEENNLCVLASRLRSKLGVYEGNPYFETVWGIGYRWSLPVICEEKEV